MIADLSAAVRAARLLAGGHGSSDSSSDSDGSDDGSTGGIPLGCKDKPHDDHNEKQAKLYKWGQERLKYLRERGTRVDGPAHAAPPPPAQASSWEAALGGATKPISVQPLFISAPPAQRPSTGQVRFARFGSTALLLSLCGPPIAKDSFVVFILGEDQDGKVVTVCIKMEGGGQLGRTLDTVAEAAERLFASRTSVALRNPRAGRPTRRALTLIVECSAALDAPQPGGGDIIFMGATPLPLKSSVQLCQEADAACVGIQDQGADSSRRSRSRVAFAMVMDAVVAAGAEAGSAAAVLLQNLSIAEAKRKHGSKMLALAYAAAALRIKFPAAPAKVAVQAAQILEQDGQYACAVAILHGVQAPDRATARLAVALIRKARRAGVSEIRSDYTSTLSKTLAAHQHLIATRGDDGKVDALASSSTTVATLKKAADAAFRKGDLSKAMLHWRAALRALLQGEEGEALPHVLMLRSAAWCTVRSARFPPGCSSQCWHARSAPADSAAQTSYFDRLP